MKKLILIIACVAGFASNAFAGSSTTALSVIVSVVPIVDVVATCMDFGRVTAGTTRDISAYININASSGQNITSIELDDGMWPSGGLRRMASANPGEFVTYGLYQDAARSTLWDSTHKMTFAGPGTPIAAGGSIQFEIFGRLQIPSYAIPGDYSDTVTVTVNY